MTQLTVSKYMRQDVVTKHLEEILGRNAKQFVSSALQAVASNTLLEKASPESVYGAVVASAVMNLPINQNLGHAYIVPYKGQAQLQIGWKGFYQLAIRSRKYKTIHATEIYENQFDSEDVISGEVKINNVKGEGQIVGYLAYFKLHDGFEKWLYMTKQDAEKHGKKYSQSYKKGFGVWADGEDGFNAMAKKTVLKLLLNRYGVLSIELQKAVEADQGVITPEGEVVEYPDNEEPDGDDKKDELRESGTTPTELP